MNTLHTEGSGSISLAPTAEAAAPAPSARLTYGQRKHSFCGAELSALKYIPKASERDPNLGTQIIYSMSHPIPHGKRIYGKQRVVNKSPLKVDDGDRILSSDSPMDQASKRRVRCGRLRRTALCTVQFPNWKGVKTSDAHGRQQSRYEIAKELSKLVVSDFDEC